MVIISKSSAEGTGMSSSAEPRRLDLGNRILIICLGDAVEWNGGAGSAPSGTDGIGRRHSCSNPGIYEAGHPLLGNIFHTCHNPTL